ncbi:MAG TPA: EI24 domain-containing protein [Sphingomonas sp.]|jgi:uncharacterized protein involved in cysteine biosynthesis|uniref:EI24 domain-containing protein n=1 Tax=Sphingomonas sp. TaxID=28214 RepID=UPI002ED9667C
MIGAFLLALRQLRDPAILRVVIGSVAVTLLIFVAGGYGLYRWLESADVCVGAGAVALCTRDLAGLGTVAVEVLALWFLFPAVAIGVTGAWSDSVVAAVERRHYPAAASAARPPGWGRSVAMGLRSAGRLIGYNVVALPFYILLIVTGVGPFLLALAVNGVVLGRDLWEMVAARHMASAAIKRELGETRPVRLGLGLVAAVLFVVPVVNLIAPILGAAMATHLYHRRRR